ncbi:MAG: DNA polymerase III subunit beta [Nitrospirota bacterium]|jgi:DNA polymerase-3 subunit beta
MRFTIGRAQFLAPLQRVQGVVGARSAMPILANVLLRTDDGHVELVATNLEIGLRDRVEADVQSGGEACVSARKLYEVVKELPEAPILVSAEGPDRVTLKVGRSTAQILGMPTDEFPALPEVGEGEGLTLDGSVLRAVLTQTAFAISTDITRQTLGGVLFNHDGAGSLEVVATDGHRLAVRRVAVAGEAAAFREIVPRKAVAEIRRLLEESDDPVALTFAGKHATLTRGPLTLVTRLIEGRYPEYQRAIPGTCKNLVVVDRDVLAHACRRVAVLANEKTNGVELDVAPGQLTIATQNPDMGEAHEEVPIQLDGEGTKIGFNARYLLDLLGVMATEQIHIEMNDGKSPSLFSEGEGSDYRCVLMPMRL